MKFSKTFCKPSSTVTVVPVGLPIKLQYNQFGLLQKFTVGFSLDLDPQYEDSDVGTFNYNAAFAKIKQIVPTTISTSGGTTWVYGVLYTDRIPCSEGMLPQALFKDYIKDIINGGKYEFYAGYVHSLAASFKGPLVIRNFLAASKFDMLPQIIVPLTMTDETLQHMMNPGTYPFNYAFIGGFFIFEELSCRYVGGNLLQINVTNKVSPFVDSDGYLKGEVVTESGRKYTFNYSAIIRHGVEKGCTLLVERESESSCLTITSTRVGVGAEKVIDNSLHEVKCPICKKKYMVGGTDAPVQCDDPHCLSHAYKDALKMLNTLGLPTMSYNSFRSLVDSKNIICLTDLLELPPCKDIDVKVSMATAMYAVIPTSVVPNYDILERLANKVNNSIETLTYYLENPLRIETDLDIVDPMVKKLADWLKDPYNVSTITTILSQVDIDAKLQKFDGAPIFRGNTIAITGRFKRGDYPEIESILKSYAAEVVPSIEPGDKLPDVVIVGSLMDGISGQLIQKAKTHHIPIQYEDEFFEAYEIDKDLAQNLL